MITIRRSPDSKPKPTKDNLLSRIGQEAIMLKYLNLSSLPQGRFHSPFYADGNPDCLLYYDRNNRLVFKDYGSYDFGDCFWVAMKMTGLSFNEVLNHIDKGFDVSYQAPPKPIKPMTRSQVHICPYHRPLSKADREYWSQYGIEPHILDLYNVSSCSSVSVSTDTYSYLLVGDTHLTFSYMLGDGIYKIYRPYDKQNKWKNNYSKATVEVIEGFNQLKGSKELIITKALKEVMFIRQHLSIDSVASSSETKLIPPHIMSKLLAEYDEVYLMLDQDEAGITAQNLYLEAYPSLIPLTIDNHKNITDMAESEGVNKAIHHLCDKLNIDVCLSL